MMVIRTPAPLPIDENGALPRPIVLLIGAQKGQWQARAIRILRKAAALLICTDVPSPASLHPTEAWSMLQDYLDVADVVGIWCGNGDDRLYLWEWMQAAWVLALYRDKLVFGTEEDPDHPMASVLGFMVSDKHLTRHTKLENVLAVVHERCRQRRTGYGSPV